MKPIDQLIAAHMTDEQLIAECWERDYTYHDYTTNCGVLNRNAVSKETFNSLYRNYDNKMSASIARRSGNADTEQKFFRSL